jgi:hypothetical protein
MISPSPKSVPYFAALAIIDLGFSPDVPDVPLLDSRFSKSWPFPTNTAANIRLSQFRDFITIVWAIGSFATLFPPAAFFS